MRDGLAAVVLVLVLLLVLGITGGCKIES